MSGQYTVLIAGATSAIARAAAMCLAELGYGLILAGRDMEELSRLAGDIRIRRNVQVSHEYLDIADLQSHPEFCRQIAGRFSGVLLAAGDLGNHEQAVIDNQVTEKLIRANFSGPASLLTVLARQLAGTGGGFIIGLTSVAADRGRQSNYIYGSAKKGFDTFLQGMRNRYHRHGVRVITIRPGFVDTAMTFGRPGLFLVARPEYVGRKIVATLDRRGEIHYIPWFWRWIMLLIRLVPEWLFKRLKL